METVSIHLDVDVARRLLFARGWTRLSPSAIWRSPDGLERIPQTDEALTIALSREGAKP